MHWKKILPWCQIVRQGSHRRFALLHFLMPPPVLLNLQSIPQLCFVSDLQSWPLTKLITLQACFDLNTEVKMWIKWYGISQLYVKTGIRVLNSSHWLLDAIQKVHEIYRELYDIMILNKKIELRNVVTPHRGINFWDYLTMLVSNFISNKLHLRELQTRTNQTHHICNLLVVIRKELRFIELATDVCYIPRILPVFAVGPQYQHLFLNLCQKYHWKDTCQTESCKIQCRFNTWRQFVGKIYLYLYSTFLKALFESTDNSFVKTAQMTDIHLNVHPEYLEIISSLL